MDKWDERFLNLAKEISTWSKDPSTQVGAVAIGTKGEVLAQGYNGFPRGVLDSPERYETKEIKYQYKENEEDRVVLWVNLKAEKDNNCLWSKTYYLDERGSGENTAMAKLVSITLSVALDLILKNRLKPGVQSAPSDKNIINYFFQILSENSIKINNE